MGCEKSKATTITHPEKLSGADVPSSSSAAQVWQALNKCGEDVSMPFSFDLHSSPPLSISCPHVSAFARQGAREGSASKCAHMCVRVHVCVRAALFGTTPMSLSLLLMPACECIRLIDPSANATGLGSGVVGFMLAIVICCDSTTALRARWAIPKPAL